MDEDYMGEGIADTKYIYNQIRSHLGLYKFKGRGSEPVSKEEKAIESYIFWVFFQKTF